MSLQNLLRSLYRSVVKTEEFWFGGRLDGSGADIAFAIFWRSPIKGIASAESWTSLIDLSRTEDEISAALHKETRYEIRRAEREFVIYHSSLEQTSDAMTRFEADYAELQKFKNLHPLNRDKLRQLAKDGLLKLTSSALADGTPCSWHAYVGSSDRIRLLHSVARFYSVGDATARAAIGRANRYHHWRDIRHFKALGFASYDLGGCYRGDDADQMNVSRFKEGFGGILCPVYTSTVPLTRTGRVALALSARLKAPPDRPPRGGVRTRHG
jgi:hypothetical protein